jgi:hypothetical protein
MMNIAVLLDKLTDLELSIGIENDTALRIRVLDAQDCILAMQKKMVGDLRRLSKPAPFEPSSAARYSA